MEPTQGPYTVEHGSKGQLDIMAPNGRNVARVNSLWNQAEANAALLAASWEMKEALEAVVCSFDLIGMDMLVDAISKARAALAKATEIP